MEAKIFIPADSMWANTIRDMVKDGNLTVEQGNSCLEKLEE